MRLDRTGEGRDEFFTWIWPRLGQLGSNLHVMAEVLAEIIKAYGAEGMRYLETQQGVRWAWSDNAGQLVPPAARRRLFPRAPGPARRSSRPA